MPSTCHIVSLIGAFHLPVRGRSWFPYEVLGHRIAVLAKSAAFHVGLVVCLVAIGSVIADIFLDAALVRPFLVLMVRP